MVSGSATSSPRSRSSSNSNIVIANLPRARIKVPSKAWTQNELVKRLKNKNFITCFYTKTKNFTTGLKNKKIPSSITSRSQLDRYITGYLNNCLRGKKLTAKINNLTKNEKYKLYNNLEKNRFIPLSYGVSNENMHRILYALTRIEKKTKWKSYTSNKLVNIVGNLRNKSPNTLKKLGNEWRAIHENKQRRRPQSEETQRGNRK
jgi:hypothetical protein